MLIMPVIMIGDDQLPDMSLLLVRVHFHGLAKDKPLSHYLVLKLNTEQGQCRHKNVLG